MSHINNSSQYIINRSENASDKMILYEDTLIEIEVSTVSTSSIFSIFNCISPLNLATVCKTYLIPSHLDKCLILSVNLNQLHLNQLHNVIIQTTLTSERKKKAKSASNSHSSIYPNWQKALNKSQKWIEQVQIPRGCMLKVQSANGLKGLMKKETDSDSCSLHGSSGVC